MFPTIPHQSPDRPPAAASPSTSTSPVRNTQITSGSSHPPSHQQQQLYKYKPKKVWPPDFSQMSAKEQFRFERRYKRRVALATARPGWDKVTRLAQLGGVTFVAVYAVLFMDYGTDNPRIQGVRDKIWGVMDTFSTKPRHERRDPSDTDTDTSRAASSSGSRE